MPIAGGVVAGLLVLVIVAIILGIILGSICYQKSKLLCCYRIYSKKHKFHAKSAF